MLAIASRDGYCTIASFRPGEIGEPLTAAETKEVTGKMARLWKGKLMDKWRRVQRKSSMGAGDKDEEDAGLEGPSAAGEADDGNAVPSAAGAPPPAEVLKNVAEPAPSAESLSTTVSVPENKARQPSLLDYFSDSKLKTSGTKRDRAEVETAVAVVTADPAGPAIAELSKNPPDGPVAAIAAAVVPDAPKSDVPPSAAAATEVVEIAAAVEVAAPVSALPVVSNAEASTAAAPELTPPAKKKRIAPIQIE